MANRVSRFLGIGELSFSLGTWTVTAVSNVLKQRKSAADQTPVIRFPVRPERVVPDGWYRKIKSIEIPYSVATAALDAAPTSVVRVISMNETTGVWSASSLTVTQSIRGTDTTGTAVGDFVITLNFDPQDLNDSSYLQVEVTIDAAATTVLDIGAPRVNETG
jgi:hypothetical protein